MKQISQILSAVFSPLLIPTYAMILAVTVTLLAFLSPGVKLAVCGATFFITCLLPLGAILLLLKMKVVSDPGLNNRAERPIPYAITIVCYCACAFYLYHAKAPGWLTAFMLGGGVAAAVSAVVNIWWKISAHAAAMGGLVAMLFRVSASGVGISDTLLVTIIAVLCAGAVATARVYLERHTLMQVCAGFFNGFVCVYVLSGLIR